ncbi:MAG: carboxypeptidase regulatory-like domain-containing protein [Planctomycetes bacterium]|nr:carboxypeptidase regulatory-like domain-containing protein [Planctomycetota bacterium]
MKRTLLALLFVVPLAAVAAYFALGGSDATPESHSDNPAPHSSSEKPKGNDTPDAPAAVSTATDGARSAVSTPTAPQAATNATGEEKPKTGASLVGRIVASESTVGLEGAKLYLEAATTGLLRITLDSHPAAADAVADREGRFRITDVPIGKTLMLRARGQGRLQGELQLAPLGKGETRTVPDLALHPGAQLEGRVTDSQGAPVANARVMVRRPRPTGGPSFVVATPGAPMLDIEATTDAQGRYKFDAIPPKEPVQVSALLRGKVGATGETIEPALGSPNVLPDLVLKDGREVTGRVVDRSGRPVADADVTYRRGVVRDFVLDDVFGDNRMRSGADGKFRITGLDDRPLSVTARSADGRMVGRKRNVTPGTTDLDVTIEELGYISGKLVPAQGAPKDAVMAGFSEATVLAERVPESSGVDGHAIMMITPPIDGDVKPDGTFEIVGLEKGKYRVVAEGPSIAKVKSDALEVAPDRPVTELMLAVSPGATLAVRVTEAGNTKPVEGATVRLREKPKPGEETAPRFFMPGMGDDDEEEGSAMGLPPMVAGGGGARREVRMTARASAAPVAAGGPAGGPTGPRGGRAMRFGGPDGKMDFGGASGPKSAKTDAQGFAQFHGLSTGEYTLDVRKDGLAPSERVPVSIDPAAPPPAEVPIALLTGGALEGLVLRGGRVPASGAVVVLTGPEPSTARKRATADAEGKFSFEHLRPGRYAAKVDKPQGGDSFVFVQGQQEKPGVSVVISDGKIEVLTLEAPVLCTLAGTVLQAGAPVAGATVRLAEKSGDGGPSGMPMEFGGGKSATTGPDGKYLFADVEAGTYSLKAQKRGSLKPFEQTVEIRNDSQKIDIALPRGVIEGRIVREENREPVVGATVSLVSGGDGERRDMIAIAITDDGDGSDVFVGDGNSSAKTDKDGRFVIEDVPAGRYRVKATATGLREAKSNEVTLDTDARVSGIEVALGKAALLSGRVLGPDGGARANSIVMLRKVGENVPPGLPKISVSDREGRYKFNGLDPGEYKVSASSIGGEVRIGGDDRSAVTVKLEAGSEITKDLSVE